MTHRFRIFLTNHSQKLTLLTGGVAVGAIYFVQPHYEAISRWSLIRTSYRKEEPTSPRVMRVVEEISRHFQLTEQQKARLNVFVTDADQTVTLGSLNSTGYAFIGLPFFFKYSDVAEIPLDTVNNDLIPGPVQAYTALGQRGLDLMVLPESALHFVLARELVRLGARPPGVSASPFLLTSRGRCVMTSFGMVAGLYAAYQVSYLVNRVFRLPTRAPPAVRTLLYATTCLLGLLSQYELSQRWRRFACFEVDRIASGAGSGGGSPFLLDGALAYYDWRLRFNRFCYERCADRLGTANRGTAASGTGGKAIERKAGETENRIDLDKLDYFLPNLGAKTTGRPAASHTSPESGLPDSHRVSAWFSSAGRERWLADGDALHFGLTDALSMGLVPSPLAACLKIFTAGTPADSQTRRERLAAGRGVPGRVERSSARL